MERIFRSLSKNKEAINYKYRERVRNLTGFIFNNSKEFLLAPCFFFSLSLSFGSNLMRLPNTEHGRRKYSKIFYLSLAIFRRIRVKFDNFDGMTMRWQSSSFTFRRANL